MRIATSIKEKEELKELEKRILRDIEEGNLDQQLVMEFIEKGGVLPDELLGAAFSGAVGFKF